MQLVEVTADLNARCLVIYEYLLQAVQACEEAAPPYKNVATLFFHVLQRYFSSYLYRTTELRAQIQGASPIIGESGRFPFWDHSNVLKGLDADILDYPALPAPNRWGNTGFGTVSGIFSRINSRPGKQIALLPTHLNARRLGPRLMLSGHTLSFPQLDPLGGGALDDQWPILVRSMEPILEYLCMPREIRASSLEVLRRYIAACVTEDETPLHCDALISGSMLTLEHRLMAAQARSQNIPVMVPIHGDADGFLDEPWSGYGEATYPTHLLSFGRHGDELRRTSQYARGILEAEVPITIPASSDVIRRNIWLPERPIRSAGSVKELRLLYIPTAYQLLGSYGPFHSAPDTLYRQWQKSLLEAFPNITIKEHPTNIENACFVASGHPTELKPLPNVLDKFDAYLVDYISTGLNLVAATDKPVIYFDLGIRNPTGRVRMALEARCIVIKPETLSPHMLRERVNAHLRDEKVDAYTPEFSITELSDRREDVLVSTLKKLL